MMIRIVTTLLKILNINAKLFMAETRIVFLKI